MLQLEVAERKLQGIAPAVCGEVQQIFAAGAWWVPGGIASHLVTVSVIFFVFSGTQLFRMPKNPKKNTRKSTNFQTLKFRVFIFVFFCFFEKHIVFFENPLILNPWAQGPGPMGPMFSDMGLGPMGPKGPKAQKSQNPKIQKSVFGPKAPWGP